MGRRGRRGMARAYSQCISPFIEALFDLCVLLGTHDLRWRVQHRVPFIRGQFRVYFKKGAVDHSAPDGYRFGQRVGDALAGAGRVHQDETGAF